MKQLIREIRWIKRDREFEVLIFNKFNHRRKRFIFKNLGTTCSECKYFLMCSTIYVDYMPMKYFCSCDEIRSFIGCNDFASYLRRKFVLVK